MFWIKLVDRMNLQLRLRNKELVPRGLAVTVPILTVTTIIPLLGFLPLIANFLIITPITVGLLQFSINKLVRGN